MSKNSSNPSKSKELSLQQRIKLLLTPCKTKRELKNWIKYHLGLDIPDCTVSRYATINPLDAIWLIYDICVNKRNPDKIEELLYVASRGSGKTLGVAIAEFMIMLHDQRDVVHVGAILSQAKRCYEYQVGFMLNDKLKPVLATKIRGTPMLEKMNMEKSIFNLVDRFTKQTKKVTLEVLPCTLKSVNGPHVPLVVVDELDTVSGEGLKAFNDISGMLDSRPNREALRVGISTRKSRYGLMNKQIEEAQDAGRTVHWWTALEFAERCPDSRSGTKPTVGYVLQDEMEVITEEEWKRKSKQKKDEYFKHEFYGEKCLSCPIAALCLSDSKNQKSTSSMLKPISDPIKKAMEAGADWAISQLFNLKPSVEGIVYKEFDRRRHVKTWNQMWEILTGQKFPGECTHDIFISKCKQLKLPAYGAIDFGWSNPSTLVVFYVDNRENVYVVRCEGQTYTNNPTWIQTIKNKWHFMYNVQMYFIDMANPGDAVTMRQEGLPCPNKQVKDTAAGIQLVKKWLKSLASPVPKMFFAAETCEPILDEFEKYHYKIDAAGKITDEPAKENDHWLDALRYAMYGLFGGSRALVPSADEAQQSNYVGRDTFLKPPTAAEFAASKNIYINTDVDTSKVGRMGTLSELNADDEEDDGSMGGNGGFFWSF